MEIGASFCHVRSSIPDTRVAPWVTSGTHRRNGASPSFIVSAVRAMNDVMGFCIQVTDHWPESSMLITIAISSSTDAVACVKYSVAASGDRGFPLLISRGTNANINF
jgi:hypothetical protein